MQGDTAEPTPTLATRSATPSASYKQRLLFSRTGERRFMIKQTVFIDTVLPRCPGPR